MVSDINEYFETELITLPQKNWNVEKIEGDMIAEFLK